MYIYIHAFLFIVMYRLRINLRLLRGRSICLCAAFPYIKIRFGSLEASSSPSENGGSRMSGEEPKD